MSDLYEVEHSTESRQPRSDRKAVIKATQKSRGEELECEIAKDRTADARGALVLPWWLAIIKGRNQNQVRPFGKMPQALCAYLTELGILEAQPEQHRVHFTPQDQIILVISVTPWRLGKTLWSAA